MGNRAAEPTTLGGTLLRHAAERPDAPAVTTEAGTTTYRQLADGARLVGAALHAAGLQRGDRIAVLARNGLPYIELAYGASLAGVALVGLNFRLSPRETADIVDDCEAKLLFVEDEWRHLLAEAPSLPQLVRLDGGYDDWKAMRGGVDAPMRENDPDAVVLQMYTGGTTGRAKGVMLLERNQNANLRTLTKVWLMDETMRAVSVLPLFHVSGTGIAYCAIHVGGEIVLPREASPQAILREIEAGRITHSALVPSMLASLLAEPASRTTDFSSLRVLIYGAAPSAGTTIEEAMALMPTCAFFHGYGMTETCGGIAVSPAHYHGDHDDKPGTVGRPIETYELRIVDPNTLEAVPPGGDGEIWARGPQNTIGYWKRPEETARLLMPDGWLRTGDIGSLDEDGYLYLKDRLKDMIISGGENVYSVEVESVLVSHQSVLEAAVYGVPDERWGESVRAAVSLVPGHQADPQELIAHVRDRLAHYKCPKSIEIVDELPKGGSGKILKRELRDRHRGGDLTKPT